MDQGAVSLRCPECRAEVKVADRLGHGDLFDCGNCRTGLKVVRRGGLRVVHADPTVLRDQVAATRQRLSGLEAEFSSARGSLGIGVNGAAVGLCWVVYQLGFHERLLDQALLQEAALATLGAAVALELANYFLLAKRKLLRRITGDITEARADLRALERKLKDSLTR